MVGDTLTVTLTGNFVNDGGVVSSDTLALSVAGDFDYEDDYLNNGTITTNALISKWEVILSPTINQ